MKLGGIVLSVVGFAIMLIALFYEPAVQTGGAHGTPDRVYNLSLGQMRELAFMMGGAMFLGGVTLGAVGELIERLEASGILKPLPAPSKLWADDALEGERPCTFCGEVKPTESRCSVQNDETLRRIAREIDDPKCREALAQHGYLSA